MPRALAPRRSPLLPRKTGLFIHHTHFDERGLGHLALGLAKVSKAPVAVIVTSGTAVANLYPALIEAGLTGEKLILLTADRPRNLSTAALTGRFVSTAFCLASFTDGLVAAPHPGHSRQLAGLNPRPRHERTAQRRATLTARLPSRCTVK